MKYPRNPKEAERALETYRLELADEMPLITVNLVSDIEKDYEKVRVMDVMLINGTPCENPCICIKSMDFDLCDSTHKELEIRETYMEVRNFVSAADAISQFVCSQREIAEIL